MLGERGGGGGGGVEHLQSALQLRHGSRRILPGHIVQHVCFLVARGCSRLRGLCQCMFVLWGREFVRGGWRRHGSLWVLAGIVGLGRDKRGGSGGEFVCHFYGGWWGWSWLEGNILEGFGDMYGNH